MYINTPVGKLRAPQHEAERVQAMDDATLLAAVDALGFIDPFALHEALRRGIWRDTRPKPTMAQQVERIIRENQEDNNA